MKLWNLKEPNKYMKWSTIKSMKIHLLRWRSLSLTWTVLFCHDLHDSGKHDVIAQTANWGLSTPFKKIILGFCLFRLYIFLLQFLIVIFFIIHCRTPDLKKFWVEEAQTTACTGNVPVNIGTVQNLIKNVSFQSWINKYVGIGGRIISTSFSEAVIF